MLLLQHGIKDNMLKIYILVKWNTKIFIPFRYVTKNGKRVYFNEYAFRESGNYSSRLINYCASDVKILSLYKDNKLFILNRTSLAIIRLCIHIVDLLLGRNCSMYTVRVIYILGVKKSRKHT